VVKAFFQFNGYSAMDTSIINRFRELKGELPFNFGGCLVFFWILAPHLNLFLPSVLIF